MTATIKTSLSIQKTLLDQAEGLAQRMGISQDELFVLAVERMLQEAPGQAGAQEPPDLRQPAYTPIQQGDVYWVQLEPAGYPHPHVVVQEDVFNRSRIRTVIVCALTTNIKRAKAPGNVLLEAGEANLPKQSVVEVSKVATVEKAQLGEAIGALSMPRVSQILAGMQFLQSMTDHPEPPR